METSFKLPPITVLQGRQEFVIERCRGKRVLHIGCVDAGVLDERFQAGTLMHQRLAAVASELWGLDIDAEGIAFLAQKGFKRLVCGDFGALEPTQWDLLKARPFDVIAVPEVVEHLMNPGLFLAAARSLMRGSKCELIVSVPNAFRLDNLIGLFRGVENVHPDHNYYFSYHTATNVLRKAGFSLQEVYLYSFEDARVLRRWTRLRSNGGKAPGGGEAASPPEVALAEQSASGARSLKHRILANLFFRYSPFWADGLILVSTLKDGEF